MLSETQIKFLVALAFVALAAILLVQGRPMRASDLASAFSYVVTCVAFALLAWERVFWSWRIFRPWLTSRPDLRGTWKGQLQSSWTDGDTGQKLGAMEVYLVIRQTYSTIDVRLLSVESSSVSLSGNVFADSAGVYTLAYTYRLTPNVLQRERSPIRHGGTLLSIRGDPVHQVDGEYWTDQGTRGQITFHERTKKLSHDFRQAAHMAFEASEADH
jgi:hypothetical protein